MPVSISGAGTINDLPLPTDSLEPGLVHLHTETFSSTSSVTVNDVFSSEYNNYKIVLKASGAEAGTTPTYMRMISSGGTYTTSTYIHSLIYNSHIGGPSRGYAAAQNAMQVTNIGDYDSVLSADIFSPNVATSTLVTGTYFGLGSTANYSGTLNATEYSSTQHTGFIIYPNTGTVTGTIRIYGYRNS